MKQSFAEKYLGFYLAPTAAESTATTVDKRLCLVNRAIYDARAVVEDSRAVAVGGLTVMFNIWEQSVCPFLYYASECWTPLNKKTLNKLNKITITYQRVALGLGKKEVVLLFPSSGIQEHTYLLIKYFSTNSYSFIIWLTCPRIRWLMNSIFVRK